MNQDTQIPQISTELYQSVVKSTPLSYAQERLWFLDQLQPSAVYNIVNARRLRGPLDLQALECSLAEIIRRHETLRTRIEVEDGQPLARIAALEAFHMEVVDLSELSAGEGERAAQEQARLEAEREFDLERGGLVRAKLVRLSDENHVLLLMMHHIISDGWSMNLLSRELGALYRAYADGRESPLKELGIQYADYAVWQRQYLSGEVLARQLNYWREQLSGSSGLLQLPTDRVRPALTTSRGGVIKFRLGEEVGRGLRALSRRAGATMFMTLLAAFQVLLWRLSGERDISVGTPVAGRTRAEVEALIGLFVNTLVIRTRVEGRERFTELLSRVRQSCLGAYEHQELPFERLVEELQPERSLSYQPLFQVMFQLQKAGLNLVQMKGLEVSGFGREGGEQVKFDLSLAMVETGRELRGALSYNSDLFEPETIERMVGSLRELVTAISEDAEQPVGRLPILSQEQRQQLLYEWNRTSRDEDKDEGKAGRCEEARE